MGGRTINNKNDNGTGGVDGATLSGTTDGEQVGMWVDEKGFDTRGEADRKRNSGNQE